MAESLQIQNDLQRGERRLVPREAPTHAVAPAVVDRYTSGAYDLPGVPREFCYTEWLYQIDGEHRVITLGINEDLQYRTNASAVRRLGRDYRIRATSVTEPQENDKFGDVY